MTIAIGILSEAEVIIATDSQETAANYWKRDEAKVRATSGPRGQIALAGAGHAGYVDALVCQVEGDFNNREGTDLASARTCIQASLFRFYSTHVVPFKDASELEVELLIGVCIPGEMPVLLKTNRATLTDCDVYAAIGVGAGHALPLLGHLTIRGGRELAHSLATAGYVIAETKQSVADCGYYTDVAWLGWEATAESGFTESFGWLHRPIGMDLDRLFHRYSENVQTHLATCLFGGDVGMREYAMKEFDEIRSAIMSLTTEAVERGTITRPA
ncbi:MAG TPA: hypothetical protein VHB78_00855 [Vicinamibacterales bacterium]|nr:hypothetical protein [Vicinamibacterales bacterium]